MVNWEFFDNQTPESACALIDDLEAGKPLHPTRGSAVLPTFKETEHVLAGFLDGHEQAGRWADRYRGCPYRRAFRSS